MPTYTKSKPRKKAPRPDPRGSVRCPNCKQLFASRPSFDDHILWCERLVEVDL